MNLANDGAVDRAAFNTSINRKIGAAAWIIPDGAVVNWSRRGG